MQQIKKNTYIHTYIRTYVHTYIRTYTHTHAHTHTNKFRIIRVFTWFSFRRYKVWELVQSVFSECALRISRIITEGTVLLYEKGDANLETSHREWGPWVNTNHLGGALGAGRPTLGYFPNIFTHNSVPSKNIRTNIRQRWNMEDKNKWRIRNAN